MNFVPTTAKFLGGTTMRASALMMMLFLAACAPHAPEAPAPESLPRASVRVAVAQDVSRPATEQVVGTVTAKNRPVVAAKLSGTISALNADVGDTVTAGQLLAEIDAREINARLNQALPELERAEQDLERMKKLLAERAIAQRELDDADARYRRAVAAVDEARTMLDYTKVTAPIDGVVRVRRVDVGDLAAPGRALFELESVDALRFEAALPESITGHLKRGDTARVFVDALGTEIEARLSEITPSADPLSRTFLTRFDLPPTPGLVAGQFGRVRIPLGAVSELCVPREAVVERGQMQLVFVVADQTARLRIVKTGQGDGDNVVILSGLRAGEEIVVTGADKLIDGQPLEVVQ